MKDLLAELTGKIHSVLQTLTVNVFRLIDDLIWIIWKECCYIMSCLEMLSPPQVRSIAPGNIYNLILWLSVFSFFSWKKVIMKSFSKIGTTYRSIRGWLWEPNRFWLPANGGKWMLFKHFRLKINTVKMRTIYSLLGRFGSGNIHTAEKQFHITLCYFPTHCIAAKHDTAKQNLCMAQ